MHKEIQKFNLKNKLKLLNHNSKKKNSNNRSL